MFEKEPIMNIKWIDTKQLDKNNYNPNIVFTPELNLLKKSILDDWWIQPIIINPNNIIIDWFHRYMLSSTDKDLQKKYNGKVPCVVRNVDDLKAMIITIRINKAKWSHMVVAEQKIIKKLYEWWYSIKDIQKELGMSKDEVELLLSDTVFKKWDLKNYKYSKAWRPKKTKIKLTEAKNLIKLYMYIRIYNILFL